MPSFAPDASVAILAIVRPADRPLEHCIIVTYPQLAVPAGTLDPHLNIRLTAQEIHEDTGPIPRTDELVDISGLVDQKGGDETRFVLWDRVLDRSDIEDMKVTMTEEGAEVRLLGPLTFTENVLPERFPGLNTTTSVSLMVFSLVVASLVAFSLEKRG
ncbi:hypothetical protein LZ554_001222 [Drepanopeziza brunnea f. sp. 'monogermtubi']|nr:hypothetical protein LZ554_001222 [Drepanopeziza brunnea f. sp. 'monogermtubi']